MKREILCHYVAPQGDAFALVYVVTDDAGQITYEYEGHDAVAVFGRSPVTFGRHEDCGEEGALAWIGEVALGNGCTILKAGKSAPRPSYDARAGEPVEATSAAPAELEASESEEGTFRAWLVTGDTYPARRDLRYCGGRYDRDQGGYILPLASADQITRLKSAWKLEAEIVTVDYDPLMPETDEQRRERREAARLRRADRLVSQAKNRERDAAAARAKHRPYTSDWSFLTQPILVGHHSEKGHRRLWDRIDSARDAEMRNSIEASELRARAERLRAPLPVKGEAAARHQAARDKAEASGIRLNSIIKCAMFGEGRVVKVNTQTYTVKFDRGFSQAIDKGWATLLRQGEAAPAPAFKKGDKVMAQVFFGHGKPRLGTIQRRTPRGYSVLMDGEQEPRTIDEARITHAAREEQAACS